VKETDHGRNRLESIHRSDQSAHGRIAQGNARAGEGIRHAGAVSHCAGGARSKTKELIALAIGITARCDGCLAFHAKAAKKHGATREEIVETIGVALYMGGGPSMIYGAEALSCFDALD
jgi:AhpD family alkylhydroperoxidase